VKKIFITAIMLIASFSNAQINLILDTNFGNNGIVSLGPNLGGFLSYHFLNDKIMVQNYDLTDPFLIYSKITMLNSNGSLSTDFGIGGSFLIPTDYNSNNDADFVHSIDSAYLYMISGKRYLYNGTLDTTYGNNGQTQIYPNEIYRKLLPTGKLIIRTVNNIYQYTQSGNLDTTLGVNGSISTKSFLTNYGYQTFNYKQNFVPLLSSNSILEYDGNYSQLRKMNYITGAYDTSFGINGNAQFNNGNSGSIMKFHLLDDYSFINYLFDSNNTSLYLLTRTFSTGLLDYSFGTNGKIDLPLVINGINLLYNQDFTVTQGNYIIPVLDDDFPRKLYLANFTNNGLSTINSQNLLDTGITTQMVNPSDKIFISLKDNYLYLFVNTNYIKRYIILQNYLSTNENELSESINFINPFQNELNLFTSTKVKLVEVFDEQGRLLLRSKDTKLNTTSLLKGIYILKITTATNRVFSKKAIKN
jgi:hypothetical protein